MKTLVIYDSAYGNTAKIADVISEVAAQYGEVAEKRAGEVERHDFDEVDVLFIGTPTQGGRPTEQLLSVIDDYAYTLSPTLYVAPFDTRLNSSRVSRWLKLLMKLIGFAAPKIADTFRRESKCVVEPPEGFIVADKKGPLLKGELDRAALWARRMIGQRKQEAQ